MRDFTHKNVSHFESMPAPIELYTLKNQAPESKSLVSQLVDLFTSYSPPSTQYLKESWGKDLDLIIRDKDWETKC